MRTTSAKYPGVGKVLAFITHDTYSACRLLSSLLRLYHAPADVIVMVNGSD